jgi:hypothetical protein
MWLQKLLVLLYFGNSRTVKMQVVLINVAAKASRPAGIWLNEMCASNVGHCKRVGSFIFPRFKNTFITSACYCFASCLSTSR